MSDQIEIIDKYEVKGRKSKKCEFTGNPVHVWDKDGICYQFCPACRKYVRLCDGFDEKNTKTHKSCKICIPHERGRQRWNKECRKGLHPGKKGTTKEYIEGIWDESIDDPIKNRGKPKLLFRTTVFVEKHIPYLENEDEEDNDD
jgi:hypothetical protein